MSAYDDRRTCLDTHVHDMTRAYSAALDLVALADDTTDPQFVATAVQLCNPKLALHAVTFLATLLRDYTAAMAELRHGDTQDAHLDLLRRQAADLVDSYERRMTEQMGLGS